MKVINITKTWLNSERRLRGFNLKIILAIIHTLLLVVFTVALQYTSYIRADEIGFLKWSAVIRHNLLHIDPKPLADSVVFIDVSKDITTIDDPSAPGMIDSAAGLKGPQMVVTDRLKLTRLFAELNKHPDDYKYILCDVLFEDNAPGDSALKIQIEKLHNLQVVASVKNGKLQPPIFNVPYSPADYTAVNGSYFVKMQVYAHDSLKSFPVFMYERITSNKFTKRNDMTYLNGSPALNTIIPELYYRRDDLKKDSNPINTYDLSDLLLPKDFFSILKGKYIVIGNFENDVHNSYLGSIPGTLILWDTYLTLKKQPINIKAGWIILLFIVYFLISYWIFLHPERKLEEFHKKIHVPLVSKFIIKYISFIGILVAINIISYFYFGTYISLFYVATYLTFLQLIIDKFSDWKKYFNNFINKITRHEKKALIPANTVDNE